MIDGNNTAMRARRRRGIGPRRWRRELLRPDSGGIAPCQTRTRTSLRPGPAVHQGDDQKRRDAATVRQVVTVSVIACRERSALTLARSVARRMRSRRVRGFRRPTPAIHWGPVHGWDPRTQVFTSPLDAWRQAQRVKRVA
jgi:hypothetical protein